MAIKPVNSRQCALGQSGLGYMSGMAAGDQNAGSRLHGRHGSPEVREVLPMFDPGRRDIAGTNTALRQPMTATENTAIPMMRVKFTLVVMNGVNTVHNF